MQLNRNTLMRATRALRRQLDHRGTRFGLAMAIVGTMSLAGMVMQPPAPPEPILISLSDKTPVLSDMDRSTYAAIFAAQKKGDAEAMDTLMVQLENQLLLGHVLANRYLSPGYSASREELTTWLSNYADHPEAGRIATLARQKGATPTMVAMVGTTKPLKGDGYVFHLGRSTMPDNWYRGLRLWKEGNYAAADDAFASVGANEKLNDWQRSAGSYWQYRSLLQQKDNRAAGHALADAAQYPLTFYGQLATARQGRSAAVVAQAPYVSSELRADPAILRAKAFAELQMGDAAEVELRAAYTTMDDNNRAALVTLASEMGLANLQLRFAQNAELNENEGVFARYPMPQPMVTAAEPVMDPALVLAVARHESGFRDGARSGAGAQGMMQMMPATARHALREAERAELSLADNNTTALPLSTRLSEDALSARLGATYLKMLTREPAVGKNLMKVLAGYNAGPGAVQNWNKSARHMNDPLLYLESIPYPETHNYVLQVMAHYWIYQGMRGEQPSSLNQLAHGQWPTVS